MLLGMTVCSIPLYITGTGAVNISSVSSIASSSETYSLVIFNDISISYSILMPSCLSVVSITIILGLFSILLMISCVTICIAVSSNGLTICL